MIKSDYFVINKTDLAEFVGASLDQMAEDTKHFVVIDLLPLQILKPMMV